VPYDAGQVSELQADYVLIERAERHLSYLAETAPICLSPQLDMPTADARTDRQAMAASTLTVTEDGSYTVISGTLDMAVVDTESLVYVSIQVSGGEEMVFEAFLTSPDANNRGNGYCLYLPSALVSYGKSVTNVYLLTDGELILVQSTNL